MMIIEPSKDLDHQYGYMELIYSSTRLIKELILFSFAYDDEVTILFYLDINQRVIASLQSYFVCSKENLGMSSWSYLIRRWLPVLSLMRWFTEARIL
jgi:hypothetical protein